MGVCTASGKKGYSSGDSYRRMRDWSFSCSEKYQSKKDRVLLGILMAPGV
jgi:hypothetical protein